MSDNEFRLEKQKLLVEYILSDESIFQRCKTILKPDYFDKELQETIGYILKYSNEYSFVPTIKQIKVETDLELELNTSMKIADKDWTLNEIERFCQRGAIIQAVLGAPDHIENGDYGTVEDLVKKAVLVGLQKDLGTAYFEDPRARLEKMRLKNLIPIGFHAIDKKLYGGVNRGELTIFTGSSGAGKSLFLQNICLNWVEGASYVEYLSQEEERYEPLDVVYITLELSEELTSKRLDTMITGIDAREIFRKIDEVELKVRMKGKTCGNLRIKYLPPGSTVNDLKAYLMEYQAQKDKLPDALSVDYLDLLHPINRRINVSDLFIKDKFVTEELRALATDLDILCVTASQLNRTAIDEAEQNQAMIGGGISKIQTADNVIAIYASAGMKERGEYQCKFLKTRSSSGVDSKVYLGFDGISLRIYNLDEDYNRTDGNEKTSNKPSTTEEILQKAKRTPTTGITQTPEKEEIIEEKDELSPAETPTERLKRLQQSGRI